MSGGALAAVMFVVTFSLVFLGYPVAFVLGGSAVAFAALGGWLGVFDWPLMGLIPERIFGIMGNSILLAVPAFVAMGAVLEKSRLAEDLLTTIGAAFGRVRGGLALGVVAAAAEGRPPSSRGALVADAQRRELVARTPVSGAARPCRSSCWRPAARVPRCSGTPRTGAGRRAPALRALRPRVCAAAVR